MNDVEVTMVGNVLTAPESRRTTITGTPVITFRFASNSRRFDRSTGRWTDGDSLRVKVACWRALGENAFQSVRLGDPLVVYGRMYSRDWTDSEGNRRTSYELDAISIGHDLSRGTAKFTRRKSVAPTVTIEDAESDAAIGGEMSVPADTAFDGGAIGDAPVEGGDSAPEDASGDGASGDGQPDASGGLMAALGAVIEDDDEGDDELDELDEAEAVLAA